MIFSYWKSSGQGIIDKMKGKEEGFIKLANVLGLDANKVKIEYNRRAEMFEKWYTADTLGVVEQFEDGISVVINKNILKHYLNNLGMAINMVETEESNQLMANIHTTIAATVLSEYVVENSEKYKNISVKLKNDSGLEILAHMYIAARIRLKVPEFMSAVAVVNDPYMFMYYEEMKELDYKDLFNSAAYHTEKYEGKNKTFVNAMTKAEGVDREPSKLDTIMIEIEKYYNEYISA